MAIIRLIPSTYELSSTQYLSISNPSNMYTNTDSDTYATVNNNRNSTTEYYLYIRGFNFSDIPSNVTINSFTIKLKAYQAGVSTNTNYRPYLCSGTNVINNAVTDSLTTSVQTLTFSTGTQTWEQIVGYGSNFGIRINTRRAARNTASAVYIYGAEIEVDYTPNVLYNITSLKNTDNVDSIDPEGLTELPEGLDYVLNIYTNSIDNIRVKDNDIDVTDLLTQYETSSSNDLSTVLGQYTLVSGSFNGSGGTYFQDIVGNGVDATKTTSNYYSSDSGTITVFTYKLNFDNIPSNATITRLYVEVNGHAESTSQSNEYMCVQLRSGNTELSNELNFKSIGTSNTTQIIEATTIPTLAQLENLVLYCRLGYYGGAINGATCHIEYTIPISNQYYWTYRLTNINTDHTIIVEDAIIEIPEEDTQYEYYPITISSVNATTNPRKGTIRLVEGSNQTIEIYPDDPLITLITDNGVDVSNQLVTHGGTIPDPTVTKASGASYGFNLNQSTGYYVSANTGIDQSAAVCRIDFNLPVRCLVTIQYINYAEATYDFGVFGNIDVALNNNYYSAGTGGATITDTNYKFACNASSANTSTPQTITYEINSGEHFINIKYSKDDATGSNNDSLQWKILSIEPLESNNYYTYTLTNIQQAHSLIFIFGDVTYYIINAEGESCKLFPSGSSVYLPGDKYQLTIVPDDYSFDVSLIDNNVNSNVQKVEYEITKNNETYTVVNYIYNINNVQGNHTIYVSCYSTNNTYVKLNNNWTLVKNVFMKINGEWVEQKNDIDNILSEMTNIVMFNS